MLEWLSPPGPPPCPPRSELTQSRWHLILLVLPLNTFLLILPLNTFLLILPRNIFLLILPLKHFPPDKAPEYPPPFAIPKIFSSLSFALKHSPSPSYPACFKLFSLDWFDHAFKKSDQLNFFEI